MPELGLFPLPIVLFPTEKIPLHVFEPRYRELIAECVDEEVEFGLVLEDDEGLRTIGCHARVNRVLDVTPDGRMHVIVEGRRRFSIEVLTEGRSFRTAEVEPVEDEDDPPGSEDVQRALDLFRKLVEVTATEVDEPPLESRELDWELSARVDFGPELKQELLELRSPRERYLRFAELVQQVIDALEIEADLRDRASGNGKVVPLDPPA